MSSAGKEPHIELTVGKHTENSSNLDYFGYQNLRDTPYGSISRIPLFIDDRGMQFFIDGLYTFHTYSTYLSASRYITCAITVIIDSKRYVFHFSNEQMSHRTDFFFSDSDVGTTLPIYFDPPRGVLGSKDTQTDLRREYYVGEVLWEAQDAEQETSDDGRRRRVVDSIIQVHRGLLYKSNSTGLKQSNSLGGTSKHRYCDGSSTSKEYPDTFRDCGSSRYYKSRWVSSGRRQARRKHHNVTKRCLPRATYRSVTSKEALYA